MATVTLVSIGRELPSLYWSCWGSSVAMAANQRAGRGSVLFWNIYDAVHAALTETLWTFVQSLDFNGEGFVLSTGCPPLCQYTQLHFIILLEHNQHPEDEQK